MTGLQEIFIITLLFTLCPAIRSPMHRYNNTLLHTAGKKENMKTLSIGKSDICSPYIAMGTWAIGGGTWWGENDDALSIRTISEAMEHGIL